MASYTQRFTSLWVLIIAHYTKKATEVYSKVNNLYLGKEWGHNDLREILSQTIKIKKI